LKENIKQQANSIQDITNQKEQLTGLLDKQIASYKEAVQVQTFDPIT
jgi:hypothetical protein